MRQFNVERNRERAAREKGRFISEINKRGLEGVFNHVFQTKKSLHYSTFFPNLKPRSTQKNYLNRFKSTDWFMNFSEEDIMIICDAIAYYGGGMGFVIQNP